MVLEMADAGRYTVFVLLLWGCKSEEETKEGALKDK